MDPKLKALGKDGFDEFLALRVEAYKDPLLTRVTDGFVFYREWAVVNRSGIFVIANLSGDSLSIASRRRNVVEALFEDLASNIGR